MPSISGKEGQVVVDSSTIQELTDWELDESNEVATYNIHISGEGWQKTVQGNTKITGSFSGLYDPADPIDGYIVVNGTYTAKLYHRAGHYRSLPVRVLKIERSVSIGGADPETWKADFQSDGPITIV